VLLFSLRIHQKDDSYHCSSHTIVALLFGARVCGDWFAIATQWW